MRPKLVLLAGILLLAAAVAVDATSPAVPPEPASIQVATEGGVLACPAAFASSGRAYLHLANVGDEDARTRVLVVPDQGRRVVLEPTVPARSSMSVRLHGRVKGGGAAIVRYVGSLVASSTVWLRDGAFGGTCAPAGPRRLVLAHGVTENAKTTLAIANPGSADADVSISLLVGGQRFEPETLNKFIVPSNARRTFEVGDFAFDAADVTSVVQVNSGRVVAQALIEDDFGRTLQTAGPALAEAVALIGRADGPRATSIAAIGEDEDAAIDVRLLEPGQQGRAPGAPPTLVPADSVRLRVSRSNGAGPLAYAVAVTAGSPVASGGSWRRGRGDPAAVEAVAPAARWAGVLGLDQSGQVRALLANPGEDPVAARLTILRSEQPEEVEVTIPGGRTLAQVLGNGSGAFAVVVEADGLVAVALDAVVRRGERTIASPAVPQPAPDPVAVNQDPQAGVPGRRPGT